MISGEQYNFVLIFFFISDSIDTKIVYFPCGKRTNKKKKNIHTKMSDFVRSFNFVHSNNVYSDPFVVATFSRQSPIDCFIVCDVMNHFDFFQSKLIVNCSISKKSFDVPLLQLSEKSSGESGTPTDCWRKLEIFPLHFERNDSRNLSIYCSDQYFSESCVLSRVLMICAYQTADCF